MMYAYQQLGMERLNDALMEAGMGDPGDERDVQTFEGQTTPNAVNEFVIPALIAKQDLWRRIGEFHTDFGRPSSPSLSPAYDDFANLLEIMMERARAQYDGWLAWVEDPGLDSVDTTALDLVEMKGLDTSIASLNALIKSANLKQEAWLVLNLEAFNCRKGLDRPQSTLGR